MPSTKELLTLFFYHMGRDKVPLTVCEELVKIVEDGKHASGFVYSNKHLAGYAEELADRILNPPDSGG